MHLPKLQKLGKPWGAKGKREEVAEALGTLADETAEKAGSEESEAYEAHAVLLTKEIKTSANALAKSLAAAIRDALADGSLDELACLPRPRPQASPINEALPRLKVASCAALTDISDAPQPSGARTLVEEPIHRTLVLLIGQGTVLAQLPEATDLLRHVAACGCGGRLRRT